MFGKGFAKLFGYAIAGAIALAIGAEILSSVVSVVTAYRSGNLIPLSGAILVTVLLLLAINRVSKDTPAEIILNILGYAATGYMVVVSFVIALPFGLFVSFITASVCLGLCSFIRNPDYIRDQVHQIIPQVQSSGLFNGLAERFVPVGDGTSFALNSSHNILILNEGTRDRMIQLMRDRPLLPISYTHYVDCDVLFVTEKNNTPKFESVMKLLNDYGIQTKGFASSLLAEAIQMIPIIDSQNGLSMNDYRMTRDESTITNLLMLSPPRLTVFPTLAGLCVLIPDIDAPGLNVEPLRRGFENEVLLQRNFIHLREVEKHIESAT